MVSFLQRLRRLVHHKRSQVRAPQGNGTPHAVPGYGQLVLIVDLDGRNGQMLAQSLAKAGFEPRVVQRDNTALEALGQAAPAVVIIAGPANVNFYRAVRRAVPVPILALDPRADDTQTLGAFAAGVDQFQSGPVGAPEVVARVVALLRRAA